MRPYPQCTNAGKAAVFEGAAARHYEEGSRSLIPEASHRLGPAGCQAMRRAVCIPRPLPEVAPALILFISGLFTVPPAATEPAHV
jgi:hypothetical protein